MLRSRIFNIGTILMLMIALLGISCENRMGTSAETVSVSISVSVPGNAKTIGYDGSVDGVTGELTSIHLTLREGLTASGDIVTEADISVVNGTAMAVMKDILPGDFTIEADGYSGTVQLTHDTWSGRIDGGTGTVSIISGTLIDTPSGTVSVTPVLPTSVTGSVNVSWIMKDMEETVKYTGTGTFTAGSSSPFVLESSTGFLPGRYVLEMSVTSGSNTISGIGIMRLLPGLPASGKVLMNGDSGSVGEALKLTLTDSTGKLIEMSPDSSEYILKDDTVVMTLSGFASEPSSILVYDGGNELGTEAAKAYEGGKMTVTCSGIESGVHDITVIAADGTPSGIGSVTFTIVVNAPVFLPKVATPVITWY